PRRNGVGREKFFMIVLPPSGCPTQTRGRESRFGQANEAIGIAQPLWRSEADRNADPALRSASAQGLYRAQRLVNRDLLARDAEVTASLSRRARRRGKTTDSGGIRTLGVGENQAPTLAHPSDLGHDAGAALIIAEAERGLHAFGP